MKTANLVHFIEVIKTGDLYFYSCYHFGLVKIKTLTAGRFYRRDGENVIFYFSTLQKVLLSHFRPEKNLQAPKRFCFEKVSNVLHLQCRAT